MLSIGNRATRLVKAMNFSMQFLQQRSNVRHHTCQSARSCCQRARQESASALPLPPLKVAVACGDTVFSRPQLVSIHGNAHRAASFSPVSTRRFEYSVEAFDLRLLFHLL